MKSYPSTGSIARARQSMNPQTEDEKGNMMHEEELLFNDTTSATQGSEDPKDKKDKEGDNRDKLENPNNGAIDDEEVTDGETKTGFDEDDNGRVGK